MKTRRGRLAEFPEAADLLLGNKFLTGRIGTDSMWPVLRPGDRIEIQPLSAKEPTVGDLIVSRRSNGWICHRLVHRYREQGTDWWITRGDATPMDDPPVARRDVVGRVSFIDRPKGWARTLWIFRSWVVRLLNQSQLTLLPGTSERPSEEDNTRRKK